jgi:hypothetical protein
MVVYEDHGGGGLAERWSEDLARVDEARGQGAERRQHRPDHAVTPVEEHHQEALVRRVAEERLEVAVHVGGAPDRIPGPEAPARHAPAELEGGVERRGLGVADAGLLAQLREGRPRETAQRTVAPQQCLRDVARGELRGAGAE